MSWVEEWKLRDLLERVVREIKDIEQKIIITSTPLLPHPRFCRYNFQIPY